MNIHPCCICKNFLGKVWLWNT